MVSYYYSCMLAILRALELCSAKFLRAALGRGSHCQQRSRSGHLSGSNLLCLWSPVPCFSHLCSKKCISVSFEHREKAHVRATCKCVHPTFCWPGCVCIPWKAFPSCPFYCSIFRAVSIEDEKPTQSCILAGTVIAQDKFLAQFKLGLSRQCFRSTQDLVDFQLRLSSLACRVQKIKCLHATGKAIQL